MKDNFIRELYPEEQLYHQRLKSGDYVMCSTFIIETDFNLFDYYSDLKKAILYWTKLHPCLAFQIDDSQLKPFYIRASSDILNSLKNIDFIRFKSSKNSNKAWELIHHNELQNNVLETDLLWRIVILQLSTFRYAFTLNFHHAISDASNMYYITEELLDIIEKQIFSVLPKPSLERISYSNFEIEYPEDPRKGGIIQNLDYQPEMIKVPQSFKNSNDNFFPRFKHGIYETIDKEIYIESKCLIQQFNKSNTGLINMIIKNDIFDKFIQVCKQNGGNLNGVYQLISSLAFKKLYKLFNETNNEVIKYDFTVNSRPFLPTKIPNYVMNEYVIDFRIKDEQRIDFNDWKEFWKKSNGMYQNLNELINNLKKTKIHNPDFALKLIEIDKSGVNLKDVEAHYSFTNLGNKTNMNNQRLKIKECYQGLSFMPNSYFTIGHLNTCSIDSNSYWSFTYNRSLMNNSAAKIFMNFIKNYVHKISLLKK